VRGGVDADAVMERFRRKIERTTGKMGAEFKDYDEEKGAWMFRTTHFSRYGLDDDEEEEEGVEGGGGQQQQMQHVQQQQQQQMQQQMQRQQVDFRFGGRGGRSPGTQNGNGNGNGNGLKVNLGGARGGGAGVEVKGLRFGGGGNFSYNDNENDNENGNENENGNDNDNMEIVAVDNDRNSEDRIMEGAEDAYGQLMSAMDAERIQYQSQDQTHLQHQQHQQHQQHHHQLHKTTIKHSLPPPTPPPPSRLTLGRLSSPADGICSKMMSKANFPKGKSQSKSATEMGIFLGRSFRVGWGRDGRFFRIRNGDGGPERCASGKFVEIRKPVLGAGDGEGGGDDHSTIDLLKVHLKNSSSSGSSGTSSLALQTFSLPKGLGRNNEDNVNVETYKNLCGAVDDYIGVTSSGSTNGIPSLAFSLISALYCQEPTSNWIESELIPVTDVDTDSTGSR